MAVRFNGSNTLMRNLGSYTIFTGSYSILLWARVRAAPSTTIGVFTSPASALTYFGMTGTGPNYELVSIVNFTTVDGIWVSGLNMTENTWTCVAMTYNDSDVANNPTFYMCDSTTSSSLSPSTGFPLVPPEGTTQASGETGIYIGSAELDNPFDGDLAHLQMWNRILTINELTQAMWVPGTIADGLVGHWPMYTITIGNNAVFCPDGINKNTTITNAALSLGGPPVGAIDFGQKTWASR